MGIGVGIFLIAVGAVLDFAIKTHNTHGVNLGTIGLILMIVGVLGIALDLLFFLPRRRRTTVVASGDRVARPVYVDDRDERI